MIHLHTGKTRPCTRVLPLSSRMLPAPNTHTSILYTETFSQKCWKIWAHTQQTAFKCNAKLRYGCIFVDVHFAHHYLTPKSEVQMRKAYIMWPCVHLFLPRGFVSCLLYNQKRATLSQRTSWPTWVPITENEHPAPSNRQADNRHLHPAPAAAPLAQTMRGYFGWML